MNMEKTLRDLKVFVLVSLFYLVLLAVICMARAWLRGRAFPGAASLKAEFRTLLTNKNFIQVFAAIYLFTAMYAIKNVAARIILMFIYLGLIVKLVKADLDSRKNN